jgi:hypothetical protein
VRQLQQLAGDDKVKGLLWQVRKNLVENQVQIVDTPYVKSKNSADMWLTVEALSLAYMAPSIGRFVILSSDRDYIPLAQKLRELGKEVIGIGIAHEVNPLYVKACDAFCHYSDLVAARQAAEKNGSPVVPQDADAIRGAYIQLLIRAITLLNEQGVPAQGTRLVPKLKELCPDYDPRRARLKSTKELALAAQKEGLVKCDRAGMDFVVTLIQGEEGQAAQDPAGPPIDPGNVGSCVAACRTHFQS